MYLPCEISLIQQEQHKMLGPSLCWCCSSVYTKPQVSSGVLKNLQEY